MAPLTSGPAHGDAPLEREALVKSSDWKVAGGRPGHISLVASLSPVAEAAGSTSSRPSRGSGPPPPAVGRVRPLGQGAFGCPLILSLPANLPH